jgi:hypothetical protein
VGSGVAEAAGLTTVIVAVAVGVTGVEDEPHAVDNREMQVTNVIRIDLKVSLMWISMCFRMFDACPVGLGRSRSSAETRSGHLVHAVAIWLRAKAVEKRQSNFSKIGAGVEVGVWVDVSAGAELGEDNGVGEAEFGSFKLFPRADSGSSKTKHGHLILVMPGSNRGARSSMIEYRNAPAAGEVLRSDDGRTF